MNVEEFKETFLQHMNEDEQKVCAAVTLVVRENRTLSMQVKGKGSQLIVALREVMISDDNMAKLIMLSVIEAIAADEKLRDMFMAHLEAI